MFGRNTILVTGGAGFLGSHLCERLVSEGHSVIALDNFRTGSAANVKHLFDSGRFELIEHDVTQPYNFKVREIYNLACPASPIHYQVDPVSTIKTCVLGTINALELAKANGSKMFQASTSEIYGDPLVHPQTESYLGNVNTIGPRACYDEGKRCSETLCYDYFRQHGVDVRVARIFNTYGPRMHPNDGRVVSNFIVQALKRQPITVYGDGSQSRSFCYVDDLIDGFVRLMQAEEATAPVNLGNPNEFTIQELADQVLAKVSSGSEIIREPLPEDDPTQRQPNISRAKDLLDWEPKVQLSEGLDRTIEYFSDHLRIPR